MPGSDQPAYGIDLSMDAGSAQRLADQMKVIAEKMATMEQASRSLGGGPSEADKQLAALRQLAKDRPSLSLGTALDMVTTGAHDLAGNTLRERAEWVLEQPDIVEMFEHKKINAIKEIRARTYLGLKEAKDAMEYAADLLKQGYMTKAERERLEDEARDAIASIQSALPKPTRCPKCGHAPHVPGVCYNLASDNDCDC